MSHQRIEHFIKSLLQNKDDGPCIEWPFSRFKNGYGSMYFNKKTKTASSVVCELVYGKAPTAFHECAHSCHNKPCVRPSHLRWATHLENAKDQQTSIKDSRFKLTLNQAAEIRCSSLSQKELASKYNISIVQVSYILNNKVWK